VKSTATMGGYGPKAVPKGVVNARIVLEKRARIDDVTGQQITRYLISIHLLVGWKIGVLGQEYTCNPAVQRGETLIPLEWWTPIPVPSVQFKRHCSVVVGVVANRKTFACWGICSRVAYRLALANDCMLPPCCGLPEVVGLPRKSAWQEE